FPPKRRPCSRVGPCLVRMDQSNQGDRDGQSEPERGSTESKSGPEARPAAGRRQQARPAAARPEPSGPETRPKPGPGSSALVSRPSKSKRKVLPKGGTFFLDPVRSGRPN